MFGRKFFLIAGMLLLSATALFAGATAAAGKKTTAMKGVRNAPSALILVKHDVSPPLRSIVPSASQTKTLQISREHEMPSGRNQLPDGWNGVQSIRASEHVYQKAPGSRAALPPLAVNAEGQGKGLSGYFLSGVPPDTTGGVGPNYYIQWVNTKYAFFNKDGSMVDLDSDGNVDDWRNGNTIWSGFGGECQSSNDGDPIVLYDQLAGRWVMTQFGLGPGSGPHYQCMAVSTTGDPLGSWNRYEYQWPSNYLNDYPKLGIWPDGYYLTVNQFSCNDSWACSWHGAGVAVFERNEMIAGNVADTIYWDLGPSYGALLPADLDGDTPPPVGSPAYLIASYNGTFNDYLDLWKVHVDWGTPANSTCGDAGNDPNSSISVTSYQASSTVDQPGTDDGLDTLSDRLMFRAPYRNFGDHESIALCHTVANPVSGMRWYEIRDPGGTPVLYQEGTYSPDSEERWMGAISMDRDGNMALGYSVSSSTVSPSIRLTGRLADDPSGTMTFDETEVVTGSGHQNPSGGDNRWGDYSTMSIDPSDDCTFWYTQEYVAGTGSYIWRTRIAAFKFDQCTSDEIFSDGFEGGNTSAWSYP